MASMLKLTSGRGKATISGSLKHDYRELRELTSDIVPELSIKNYSICDNASSYKESLKYVKESTKNVYKYGRDDIKLAVEWVIQMPKDLAPEKELEFFEATKEYLNSLYGSENNYVFQIHKDEGSRIDGKVVAGQVHAHAGYLMIQKNPKYMQANAYGNITKQNMHEFKFNSKAYTSRKQLLEFHPNFQKFLDVKGIHCTVFSGEVGKAIEKNYKTVKDLKLDTYKKEIERLQEIERDRTAKHKEITLDRF